MVKHVLIVPAYNPLPQFLDYVKKVKQFNIEHCLIINDGSDLNCQPIFEQLRNLQGCTVLEHSRNLGKGAAIKTAFRYLLQLDHEYEGALLVGAHGQHAIEDVKQMLHAQPVFKNGLLLGVRQLKHSDLKLKDRLGRYAVTKLFELFFHQHLIDCQTGLRYIPKSEWVWIPHLQSNSFHFDVEMLIYAIEHHCPIYEVPIGSLRLKKNSVIYYDEVRNNALIAKKLLQLYLRQFKL